MWGSGRNDKGNETSVSVCLSAAQYRDDGYNSVKLESDMCIPLDGLYFRVVFKQGFFLYS